MRNAGGWIAFLFCGRVDAPGSRCVRLAGRHLQRGAPALGLHGEGER